ncbi:HNH endonuclease signature motif containing protein [Actinomadura fulvescens]|uniref:HNH nuclease domain-containing protein n=1 Tax=Actinomadura fulvescens TaxID=46160 RepID=A0ABN3Q9D6_9ACTN
MAAPSRRTTPLPPGWHTRIRPRILARDGYLCQWPTRPGICGRPATDVDHRDPAHLGGVDDDDNLWALCGDHHRTKTAREAGAAAARITAKRYRPAEPHPGWAPRS